MQKAPWVGPSLLVRVIDRPFFLLFLCVPLFSWAGAPDPFPGLKRQWRHYQSPNFELYSAGPDRGARSVLEKMELLRALFLERFKLPVRMPKPVTIYSFSSQKEFDGYLASDRRGKVSYGGFCQNLADRTVITLAPAWDDDNAAQVVFHEYIHCLFGVAEEHPPPWFNEGAAELFSSLTEEDGSVIMGLPVEGRVYDLRHERMMPLEQLFAVTYGSLVFRDSRHTGIFYAESWALLHYLQYGVHRIPEKNVQLFLRAGAHPRSQEEPERFRALFRELLGKDFAELQQDLEVYVRSGTYQGRKTPRPAIAGPASYSVRPAPADEMLVRLAELSLRFSNEPYAEYTLRRELDKRPEARIYELFAAMAQQRGDADRAHEYWQQAFELGTHNVATFRELGRLESNLVFGNFDLDYRMPAERAERLRLLLHKSIEAAPAQSAAYEMLAWVEATAAKPDIPCVQRVQHVFQTLNDKPRTLLALVAVRMRLGDEKGALELLDQLPLLKPNDWALFCAELTRARLEHRPVDRDRLPAVRQGPGPAMTLTPPKLTLP